MQPSHRLWPSATTISVRLALPLAAGLLAVLFTLPATAQTIITVTTPIDNLNNDNNCSLREAIESANRNIAVDACPAGSGVDNIVLPVGRYFLSLAGHGEDANQTGDFDITSSLNITGSGSEGSVIDGSALDRVLHIHPGVSVQLSDVQIRNGFAPATEAGGAILNEGHLTVSNSLVEASSTSDGRYCSEPGICDSTAGPGGGVANSMALTMTATQVSNNYTGKEGIPFGLSYKRLLNAPGGGIYNTGILRLTACNVTRNLAGQGAGVYNAGSATIVETEVFSNSTTLEEVYRQIPYGDGSNSGSGAGIANAAGTLQLRESTVYSNSTPGGSWGSRGSGGNAGSGAGILNSGILLAFNSTIAQNHTGNGGPGGVIGSGGNGGSGGGIYNTGTAVLNNVTITGNTAGAGGICYSYDGESRPGKDGAGAGIDNSGEVRIRNTIVGDNRAAGGPSDCAGSAIVSNGFNLISASDCAGVSAPTDRLGVAPHVGAVANYGGFTGTAPLFAASPAIDAGSCTDTDSQPVTHDQRGFARPQMNACDIGAYETTSRNEFVYLHLPVLTRAAPD